MNRYAIVLSFAYLSATAAYGQSDAETPPLEEMWQILQAQQAEIDALKAENATLKENQLSVVPVVPGKFAIAAFSPRLNAAGNSVRAQRAIRQIAGDLGVGLYGPNPD
ncbi:glutaminase [Congregibacter sp.]|uniref:glutaminase n=1 Tax=Congregibacter sp. TaxID=2744308 RepID=UPI003F6CE4D0